MRALFVVFAILFYPSIARAWDVELIAVPPGDDVIAAVKKGDPVPFDGQLFDINTAIRWGNWLNQYRSSIENEVSRAKGICKAELDYQAELTLAELDRVNQLNEDLAGRLARVEKKRLQAEHDRDHPDWYSTPWFGLALGVLGTAGLVFIGTQAF